jgi:hypothetical protein
VQRFRQRPFSLHGPRGATDHVRRLIHREAGEKAQLDDAHLLGIARREAAERRIDRQHIGHRILPRRLGRDVDRDEHRRPAALARLSCPRVVDENPTHDLGGHAEELRPILPRRATLIH